MYLPEIAFSMLLYIYWYTDWYTDRYIDIQIGVLKNFNYWIYINIFNWNISCINAVICLCRASPGTVAAPRLPPTGVSWADKVKARHTGSTASSDVAPTQSCPPVAVQKTSCKNGKWLLNQPFYVVNRWMYMGYLFYFKLVIIALYSYLFVAFVWY